MKKLTLALALLVLGSCASDFAGVRAKQSSGVGVLGEVGSLERKLGELQERLIVEEVTGSNVALVFRDGEVVYQQTRNSGKAGDRDIEGDTLFPIWSMSKPITIVAMLMLHERGLFEWDDPVAKYMPCFAELTVREGAGVVPATEPLRIVHLMTHRSGYTYYSAVGGGEYGVPVANQTAFGDLQQFVEAAAETPLRFEPGSDYAYGISQAILGRLVEVLSGKSFAEYLEASVFKPLGMTETSFVLDAERRSRFQPLFINSGALKGFTQLLDGLNYSPASRAHFGGEGLVSTLGDYARFCEMLLGGGVFRGKRIVQAESIATMTKSWTPDYFPAVSPGYDMGFSVYVLDEPGLGGDRAPRGIYGWSGYHNTHFWIDPASNLFTIFMTRAREFNFGIPAQLRTAVYGAKD